MNRKLTHLRNQFESLASTALRQIDFQNNTDSRNSELSGKYNAFIQAVKIIESVSEQDILFAEYRKARTQGRLIVSSNH